MASTLLPVSIRSRPGYDRLSLDHQIGGLIAPSRTALPWSVGALQPSPPMGLTIPPVIKLLADDMLA
jgi:hypothetical protein